MPGSYKDYLEKHPYVKAKFSNPVNPNFEKKSTDMFVSLLIDNILYQKILQNVNQYI